LDGQRSEFFLNALQKLEFGHCSLLPSWSGQGLISTPVHHCENLQTHTATSVSRNYISLQSNIHYIGLLSKSNLCSQAAQPNTYSKICSTATNIIQYIVFDKTAVISLYICTSIPPTKKFVSKYYDMVLGLLTSQKF